MKKKARLNLICGSRGGIGRWGSGCGEDGYIGEMFA